MPKSTLLMAPPGAGKTKMVIETAVNRPVHVIDTDRKLVEMHWAQPYIEKGDVTFWELSETFVEEDIMTRLKKLAKNENPTAEPQGWPKFAKMANDLGKQEVSRKAGTWFIDSGTMLETHLMRSVLYYDQKAKGVMSPREWQYYLMMWTETIQSLIDEAHKYDKDLIISIHEREKDKPRPGTVIMHSKGADGQRNREYIGILDLKMIPSIGGQFAENIARFFTEFYALKVVIDSKGVPQWRCRVRPDGQRDLRTSFPVKQDEFPPDFRLIWNPPHSYDWSK